MDELPLRPAQGELLVEHPEVQGALLRIPQASFNPTLHKPWNPDVLPWMDGSGVPIPGREPPTTSRPAKRPASRHGKAGDESAEE